MIRSLRRTPGSGRTRALHGIASRAAGILVILVSLPATDLAVGAGPCDGVSPAPASQLTSVRVAAGLYRPLFVLSPPGDLDRLFIVQQDGKIRILKNGALLGTPFLDISSITRSPANAVTNEEGLLGMAFHPSYASNGWFFVYHTDISGDSNIVARYERSPIDADLALPGSRRVILSFPHPTNNNHNGCMIAFGPDGHLYIGTGDGGGDCDPSNNAQDGGSNLGKILRINADSLPYTIPPDNPFAATGNFNDEIWAFGMRNPWRFSFDRVTGDLYIGDVGQGQIEEIDFQPGSSGGGENYGWDKYEGSVCPNPSCSGGGNCNLPGHVPPVLEYTHAEGCSVTGGYAYRGCRMPDLHGTYFYSDYCTFFIRTFRMVGGIPTDHQNRTGQLVPPEFGVNIDSVSGYGEDARGEIYIADLAFGAAGAGEVFKIEPAFPGMEVSAPGASPVEIDITIPPLFAETPTFQHDLLWEDLQATTAHGITGYRVYRSTAGASGLFECVHQTTTPSWPAWDPDDPVPDEIFSYVVTATNTRNEETNPGFGSGGTARNLSSSSCP